MKFNIHLVPGFNKHNFRAQTPGIHDKGARSNSECFAFVAGGNAAGRAGHHRQHSYWLAAQLWFSLMLDRCKVGIEVNKKAAQQHQRF